ncbi:hypothetical protein ACFFTK_26825 [Pseudonocardia petroleophila]|uniref:Uncharacterized protein n=1 Tax=Pseudonocardia petroleophila TaxID=37331 RepID=A0A7G7MQB0_9PSEU|nr:hypothetical protein [Pseudonocardia petroleophila]QNG54971.1 hypothetical protein H6H00_14490 [Pseudonocardia petroleophila]
MSFGGVVTAAVAAWNNASTFSCTMRVYSRRSRALGGQPPDAIRNVRWAITTGADQAISATRSHGFTHPGPGIVPADVRLLAVIGRR